MLIRKLKMIREKVCSKIREHKYALRVWRACLASCCGSILLVTLRFPQCLWRKQNWCFCDIEPKELSFSVETLIKPDS